MNETVDSQTEDNNYLLHHFFLDYQPRDFFYNNFGDDEGDDIDEDNLSNEMQKTHAAPTFQVA